MSVSIVFETHSISTDNEAGIATGWLPGRLSESGRTAARELGARRRDDGIDMIGGGEHERFVVNWDKFNARVAEKAKRAQAMAGAPTTRRVPSS